MEALLGFFVGTRDDLGPAEYAGYAGSAPIREVRAKIIAEMKSRERMPRVISAIVDTSSLEDGVSMEEAVLGFKLLGQRYTPESETFQYLVFDRVTDFNGDDTPFTLALINGRKVRGFATVLDLMAGLGSSKAGEMLAARRDDNYREYKAQLEKASGLLKEHAKDPSSVSGMNLKLLGAILNSDIEPGKGLNAAIGQWIQNRYTFFLYSKQTYTGASKNGVFEVNLSPGKWPSF